VTAHDTLIDSLSERRRRLWSKRWHEWTLDYEARRRNLDRLLEEAYEQRRKDQAQRTGNTRTVGKGVYL
jgi:hypothetical protein